jgi:hypothetical protein
MQNRMPIIKRLWPFMPRNDTEDKSGSFRLASPPAVSPEGWPNAPAAIVKIAAAVAKVLIAAWANRQRRDAA